MSATLIIGIILILLGTSAILKVAFNIDFPLLKIGFAALFIYIGIRIITGGSFKSLSNNNDDSVIFGEKTFNHVEDGKEYNVIFAGAVYDLNSLTMEPGKNKHIKLNTIFGGSKLLLNKNIPVRINSNTIFGGASLPNGDKNAFGSSEYKTDTISNDSIPCLIIEANTIFGGLKVIK